MDVLRLYIVSYHGDLWKEREILYKDILPELRAWCENKRIQLHETDVRWGGFMKRENLLEIKKQIQDAYFNGDMPFFINITSDSLGLVPMWGEGPENVIEDIHRKLQISDPETDILYGAYREDNPNSLFLVRNDSFLDDLTSDESCYFIKKQLLSKKQHDTCQTCMNKYPRGRLFHYSYSDVWLQPEGLQMMIDLDKVIFHKVLEFVQGQINRERPSLLPPINIYEQIRESHEAFMKSCSVKVKGREAVIKQLEEYIETGGKDVPVLLLGGAGSGKSSIMAKAAHQFSEPGYLDKYNTGTEDDSWLVFYHFVGAVPGSSELLTMLRRLLKELQITTESTQPRDVDSAAQMCCSALSSGTSRPLVIIVDAVNQFDEESPSQITSWVPRKLAPNIRCIISMINDTVQHKKLMTRESKPQELHLVPLDFEARKQIVTEMLSKYHQSLSRDQMNCLMAKKASENPLWLSVASEELRVIQDDKLLDRYIRDMPENLLDLLEAVLQRLESTQGDMLIASVCLLEVSVSGLLESELRMLLGANHDNIAPSPYEEKEEVESSEKDLGKRKASQQPLSEETWLEIYRVLRPYLRPYGDSREGRLDFYHRAFSKAVRCRYFKVGRENESCEETTDIYKFWHHKLADYFERCDNLDRKAEEYLCHLCQIEDSYRLSQCLCDWAMLDKLYHEEYSSQLLNYWRKAGGTDVMIRCYGESLAEVEAREPKDDKLIASRYELLARIYLQAGRYTESLELAKTVIKWEEKELGNRPERMVDLNSLLAEIYEEKLKLNDFVSPSQLPDLRKTIMYARKSIDLRKTFTGEYHKLKLATSLMKLAFSLESWNACGGDDTEMTGEEAIREGNEHIDNAIAIFQELKDAGHFAEALMTKGVLAPRGSMEQLKYYNEAMEICRQVYGEESLLSSRLYINIGIVYEDNNDYVKAYEFFKKWAEVSEIVLGPEHPKTIRAKGVLREPRYRLVALRIKQHLDMNNQSEDENTALDEEQINRDVENLDEEEDGYQSGNGSGEERGEEEEEEEYNDNDNRERQSRQQDVARQQILDASDFMQRILNDIWQQMADVNSRPNTVIAENTENTSPSNAGNSEPIIEVPPSRSLLIRSNPMRLVREDAAASGTGEPQSDNRQLESSADTSSNSAGNVGSDTDNRLTDISAPETIEEGPETAHSPAAASSRDPPVDNRLLDEAEAGERRGAQSRPSSNFRIQELCNRLGGITEIGGVNSGHSDIHDRLFGNIDLRSMEVDNRLQEIAECVVIDNEEQDNREEDNRTSERSSEEHFSLGSETRTRFDNEDNG